MTPTNQSEDPTMNEATKIERVSDREVQVTRTLDAPVAMVFDAWARPELFQRWWLPKSTGMSLESCEMDVRTGGTYRLVFAGGMAFFGRYLEVVPPTRIVWTNEEGGEGGSVTTVSLSELDGKTLLCYSEVFPSAEALEAEGGSVDAMPETLTQLDELLAELTAGA